MQYMALISLLQSSGVVSPGFTLDRAINELILPKHQRSSIQVDKYQQPLTTAATAALNLP
jgi:hypothetical protein